MQNVIHPSCGARSAQGSFSFWRPLVLVLTLLCAVRPETARAQAIVYNNLTSISGFLANGGATTTLGNTQLLGDDITFAAGAANRNVTSFTLAVANGSGAAQTATLTVEFFMINGTGNGPGTLLGSATTTASFAGGQTGSITQQTFTAANLFTIPASGQIWAGFYFTGVAGTTQADLNSLGGAVENSPTVGSSNTNIVFFGSGPAVAGSNPAGTTGANPNTGQSGNFGMAFAVPEPSSVLFALLGGAGLATTVFRRRR